MLNLHCLKSGHWFHYLPYVLVIENTFYWNDYKTSIHVLWEYLVSGKWGLFLRTSAIFIIIIFFKGQYFHCRNTLKVKYLTFTKIAFKVVQMKSLAMHFTNQKLSFDICTVKEMFCLYYIYIYANSRCFYLKKRNKTIHQKANDIHNTQYQVPIFLTGFLRFILLSVSHVFWFLSFSRRYISSHLALGGVRNVSLNLTISNAGDDAYDTNIYFNFSKEVHYINFLQRVSQWYCVFAIGFSKDRWTYRLLQFDVYSGHLFQTEFSNIIGKLANPATSSVTPKMFSVVKTNLILSFWSLWTCWL